MDGRREFPEAVVLGNGGEWIPVLSDKTEMELTQRSPVSEKERFDRWVSSMPFYGLLSDGTLGLMWKAWEEAKKDGWSLVTGQDGSARGGVSE